MQAGMKLAVRLRAATPEGKAAGTAAVARFYGPGRDPEHDPADRVPDRTAVLAFDPASRAWQAGVPTAGWAPGTWTLQGVVLGPDGAAEGWAWHRFPLDP
jgi:hypothetical protein